ncbi:hypothetical protein [Natrinema longum]|uniref:Uncharacterized protein n=1 Tax=Natrinema longum TaxID=370324 RepID=A0A8A2UCP2_9EURY|nr:hypothetical protein [Natrinema longum]MBZ6495634.1 hypothetical protein [Natrinema longum]QSW86403.1 hypothetical protein J0X27_06185 [Natrinema longum]
MVPNISLNKIKERAALWIAYGLIIALVLWSVFEIIGYTNWVEVDLPLSPSDFAMIASAAGTIVLTFGLLLLYNKQARIQSEQTTIQENQESLMEQQFTPHLTAGVNFLSLTSVQFVIQNTGNGAAFDVSAEWEVAGEKKTWEVPNLPPGEKHGFPIIVDGDSWLLSIDEIKNYLEENNASSVIDYRLTCEDRFEEEKEFSSSVDFGVIVTRSESDEIWNEEPLEEISGHMRKMQRDIRKMRRYQQNNDKNEKWRKRIEQTKEIYGFIQEYDGITVEELNSLTNISEQNIRYRLQSLDDAGGVHYNSNTDTVQLASESQTALSEF